LPSGNSLIKDVTEVRIEKKYVHDMSDGSIQLTLQKLIVAANDVLSLALSSVPILFLQLPLL
jgi:hypothetical protein